MPTEADPLRDISVMALAVSQDGTLFATGSKDGQVQLWRAADGTLVRAMPKQGFLIGSLTFAKGSRLITSCGYRCADKHRSVVWNTDTGEKTLDYPGHDGTVYASAANADGSLVATAGVTRNAIQDWDPATGERKALLQGAGEPVTAIGFDAAYGVIAWGNANPCPERVACPEQLGALDNRLELPTTDRFFVDPQPLTEPGSFARAATDRTTSGRCTPPKAARILRWKTRCWRSPMVARWCAFDRERCRPTASSIPPSR